MALQTPIPRRMRRHPDDIGREIITIRVSNDLRAKIQAEARKSGLAESEMVRRMAMYWLLTAPHEKTG